MYYDLNKIIMGSASLVLPDISCKHSSSCYYENHIISPESLELIYFSFFKRTIQTF